MEIRWYNESFVEIPPKKKISRFLSAYKLTEDGLWLFSHRHPHFIIYF